MNVCLKNRQNGVTIVFGFALIGQDEQHFVVVIDAR